MKKVVFLAVVICFAVVGQMAQAGEGREFVCALNKGFALHLELTEGEAGIEQATLDVRDFMGNDTGRAAHLSRPGMQATEYGNVLLASQDFGRSGYAWIRVEHLQGSYYKGYFDLNLFNADVKPLAGGRLTELSCFLKGKQVVTKGNGSEACVEHCTSAASDAYPEGTAAWSNFFRGCMLTCWM